MWSYCFIIFISSHFIDYCSYLFGPCIVMLVFSLFTITIIFLLVELIFLPFSSKDFIYISIYYVVSCSGYLLLRVLSTYTHSLCSSLYYTWTFLDYLLAGVEIKHIIPKPNWLITKKLLELRISVLKKHVT